MAHIDPDQLELYVLGRLTEAEIAPIEEHLLVCYPCQDALEEIDQELATLVYALKRERAVGL